MSHFMLFESTREQAKAKDETDPTFDENDPELLQWLAENGKPLFEFEEEQVRWGNGPMPE